MNRAVLLIVWCCATLWLAAQSEPAPKQSQGQPAQKSKVRDGNALARRSPATADKSPWLVRVASAESVKPGTENEPLVPAGAAILKIGVKFQYTGPQGDVPAPVLKVTDGAGKEYVMLGNLQGRGAFACFEWLISASHVSLGEKPETLASNTIAKCKDEVVHYYFILPASPKQPLSLVFADAPPIRLSIK